MRAIRDFRPVTFNPKYKALGLVTWAGMFLFEYLAPIVEATGWVVVPVAVILGALDMTILALLVALAFGVGLLNSLLALTLDESFGYFNSPKDTTRLLVMALIENLGFRQLTVAWRVRAIFGSDKSFSWGNMERKGITHLGLESSR